MNRWSECSTGVCVQSTRTDITLPLLWGGALLLLSECSLRADQGSCGSNPAPESVTP